jgi:hypothetical protein
VAARPSGKIRPGELNSLRKNPVDTAALKGHEFIRAARIAK